MAELKIGISLPTMAEVLPLGPGAVAEAARRAESSGLDSVGAADVLIGDGTVSLESIAVVATAAAVTQRVSLDFGVLSLPTRPTAMLAAQIQTLQYLSQGRIRLGVGLGGFAGSPFWAAVNAPAKGRGRLVDVALEELPRLIAGEPTPVGPGPDQPIVTLAPGTPVPPIMIGGGDGDAVLRRVVAHGDFWLPSFMTPGQVAAAAARLRDLAESSGRRRPPGIQIGVHAVLGDDPADRTAREAMWRELGPAFAMTPEQIAEATITGGPAEAAERLAAYAEVGIDEVGIGVHSGDYLRQLDLIAEVRALLR
ncbi:LLM class flavin-dependent oxidoreductase [Streptosporangium sp. KLBMP 9127]|nr:LLM class flavin-dependent oxidoreductase [Streptosporangium sp. KLBMP 9127]